MDMDISWAGAKARGATAFSAGRWADATRHYGEAATTAAAVAASHSSDAAAAGAAATGATVCASNAAQAALNAGDNAAALAWALQAMEADGSNMKAAYRGAGAALALIADGALPALERQRLTRALERALAVATARGASGGDGAAMAALVRDRYALLVAAADTAGGLGGSGGAGGGDVITAVDGRRAVPPAPLTRPAPPAAILDPRWACRGVYSHSHDGVDENLLIVLHGLGDTAERMAAFATRMQLPQCAVWALQAPPHPLLLAATTGGGGGAWYDPFDAATADLLPLTTHQPRRAAALAALVDGAAATLAALAHSGWPPDALHLLGFGDGATVALHVALACAATPARRRLCHSIVAVGGTVLLPDTPPPLPPAGSGREAPTLLCIGFDTPGDGAPADAARAWRDTEATVRNVWMPSSPPPAATAAAAAAAPAEGSPALPLPVLTTTWRGSLHLPRNRDEMHPIMAHFGGALRRRSVALESDPTVIRVA